MDRPIRENCKDSKNNSEGRGYLARESNREWSRTSAFLGCQLISGKEGSLAQTLNIVTPNIVLPEPLGTCPYFLQRNCSKAMSQTMAL